MTTEDLINALCASESFTMSVTGCRRVAFFRHPYDDGGYYWESSGALPGGYVLRLGTQGTGWRVDVLSSERAGARMYITAVQGTTPQDALLSAYRWMQQHYLASLRHVRGVSQFFVGDGSEDNYLGTCADIASIERIIAAHDFSELTASGLACD